MLTIDPTQTAVKDLHQYLLGSVAPRPIAFVSTVSADGIPNLAPYSFFNVFSSNPPILVFSSNRRVANNTTKDTLRNVEDTREAVINVVSYTIVRQMALASIEYGADVDEFVKSGLTPLASECVKPFRVAESPVQMECKVNSIVPLGEQAGAGHLIICELVRMHISKDVLSETGRIDPHKIDLMARMGGHYYARASGGAILEINQPVTEFGVGFDGLPATVRTCPVLTGNHLARLAALKQLPTPEEAEAFIAGNEQAQASLGADMDWRYYVKDAIETNQIALAAAVAILGAHRG